MARIDFADARRELEKFVLGNIKHVNRDQVRKIAPDLAASEEEDWLTEFVRTQNPYDVLQACFAPGRRYMLADSELFIDPDEVLEERDLIGEMLVALGFRREIIPTGLPQIWQQVKRPMEEAEHTAQIPPELIEGLTNRLARGVEDILDVLFLFHSHVLADYADVLKLSDKYQVTQRTLGTHVMYIKELRDAIQADSECRDYCNRLFHRDIPLPPEFVYELEAHTEYRNLIIHKQQDLTWQRKKQKVEDALSGMSMNRRRKWQENWACVTEAWETARDLPRQVMLKRMFEFVDSMVDFLLGGDGAYPQTIVMCDISFDDYGTCKITAQSDRETTVYLTDCEFEPFVEFHYFSRTNPIGIDPVLVAKEELGGKQNRPDNASEQTASA